MSIKDSKVIIEISNKVLAQDSLVENLRCLSNAAQHFLSVMISVAKLSTEMTTEENNLLISREQIQDQLKTQKKGASDALISRRLRELIEIGAATVTTHVQPARSRLNHYVITDLAPLARLPPLKPEKINTSTKSKRRTSSMFRKQQELFKRDNDSILLYDPQGMSIYFHERVFNGILDAAMRLSGKDERRVITAECAIGGQPLKITSTCSSNDDSQIALLTDQRAMRTIISYCKKEIARRKVKLRGEHGEMLYRDSMVPNVFNLDIHDLCELMGMKPLNANLDNIVLMMRRLADTTFHVDASENRWFRETFSLLSGAIATDFTSDIFEFRFLNNFEIARENVKISDLFGIDVTELRPRFYTFTLEIRLFNTLILEGPDSLFLSHEQLSKERSGIVQRFYNWSRAFVSGRTKPGIKSTWYSIDEMHDHLTPAARKDNFRSYFMRALEKFAINNSWKKGESGVSLIYGYYVYYKHTNGVDRFRLERDPHDPIVGDDSRHNQILRHQLLLSRQDKENDEYFNVQVDKERHYEEDDMPTSFEN